MNTPTISQRPLLIGIVLERAARRDERRRVWRRRFDRWSRIACFVAALAVVGFITGAAIAIVWILILPRLLP